MNGFYRKFIHFFYCFAVNILNGKLNYPNKCGFPFKKGLFHSET